MDDIAGPTAIRLLILSTSRDRTEQISTSLRNGGLAVHSTRISNVDRLEQTLEEEEPDLVICCSFERDIDLDQTMETMIDQDRDIPLLIMSDAEADPERLIQAMRQGAKDLVDKDDMEHLQLVVAREFANLNNRRELAALRLRMTESEQRCMGLIESSGEPIAFAQGGMHVHVNPAYLKLFGFEDREEVEDLPLLDVVDKSHHKEFRQILKQLEGGKKRNASMKAKCKRLDGTEVEVTMDMTRAAFDGEPGIQVIIRNSEAGKQEMEQELQRVSTQDSATDLPNRQHFLAQLDHWLDAAAEDNEVRALAYIVIDNFHKLHSSLGMNRCDELVRGIANLLSEDLTDQDLLARFSDSAFTLLCRRADAIRIETFARELCEKIAAAPFPDVGEESGVTCSIGVTFLADFHIEPQDVINEAYNAADSAREQGGNQVVMNREESELSDLGEEDQAVLRQIDQALAHDRFRLVYQPIVSLQGDTRENYAVLVRMLDDADGEVLPESFIRQAERFGKMVELDRWIIRNAIASLSKQRRQGRKVSFFISLSEASLTDKNTLLWICDCLREFEARGGWLTFQIREKHAREHLKPTAQLIDGLKKIKCQIAIDHFGLQSKPEALLNHLQVDFAKLAPSFVRELNSNQQKQDELNSLNEAILNQNIKTIATGVEDANSLTVLWTVGVGYIQGYFLQEPSETIEYGSTQQLT